MMAVRSRRAPGRPHREEGPMALPTLSPEQRQATLEKAREARPARSALLAGLKAGTLTLADVLARADDIARRTSVAQVVRALPGVGPARAAAAMERAGIILDRRVGGLGARQREQLLAEFPGRGPVPVPVRDAPLPQGPRSRRPFRARP